MIVIFYDSPSRTAKKSTISGQATFARTTGNQRLDGLESNATSERKVELGTADLQNSQDS